MHGGLLKWWPRKRSYLGIFEVFYTWLGHAPTWSRVPKVNVKPKITLQHSTKIAAACHDDLKTLLMQYLCGTRSIRKLIKHGFHQVFIDLNHTSVGGVMAFPIKYYRGADKNVMLQWSCTPRCVLSMVHQSPMSYRGHVWSLSKVPSILKSFAKHVESANIK
jgi:hypothetical protein